MYNLGLIGKNLQHSFSKKIFQNKFKKERLKNFSYNLYELNSIEKFNLLLEKKNLIGLNITSPYKASIIKYIDHLDDISRKTKSVNTVFINRKKRQIKGYNTDFFGFKKSLKLFLPKSKLKALVLGNGGVSKSICYALKELNIEFLIVSRKKNESNIISYEHCDKYLETHKLIINTTILGSKKLINYAPKINYKMLSEKNYMYDVVYNPKETLFLKKGKDRGANIMNGEKMLILQAELSFEIWKKEIQSINV
mgnify:CR=1 FL=1